MKKIVAFLISFLLVTSPCFATYKPHVGSKVDSNNSTTSTLGIDAVFTGTGTDVLGYNNVSVQLFADQDSATSGISIEFSIDNSNWDEKHIFTLTASETRNFQFPCHSKYFRLVYTNGGTGQGAFRVQTVLHQAGILTTIHRLGDDVDPDRSSQLIKSIIIAQKAGSGDFTPLDATSGGNLKVSLEEFESTFNTSPLPVSEKAKTAFGELLVAEPTPVVQLQFPYNINTDIIEKRENNAGTITQSGGMAVIQSGASVNSAAHMLSRATLKYGSGQGAEERFTALFTTGQANSTQLAGIGDVGDGLFFGYNGSTFSVLRREQGKPEIQTLTISAGAVTSSGNITIAVDGVDKVVAVALNDTAREVAVKIADADFDDTGLGWTATVNNATIIFKAWSDGNKSGSFTLTDTDTTGAAGTFAETVAGASTTNNWIAQSSWNADKFDGTGSSGVTLDPTKGNVYRINYQWLGFGLITFSIEDPDDGEYHAVHRIKYANANTTPSLQNPTLPLHVMSKNTSNTSNLTIKTSSMGGFVEGKVVDLGLLNSGNNNITTLGTTELPILSIKNKLVYQGTINRVRIKPLFLSLATLATKPIIFRIRFNPTLTGTPAFSDVSANSVMSVDTASTGLIGGREVFATTLAKEDSLIIDFSLLRKMLNPGDIVTITAEAVSGANHEVSVTFTGEDLF